MMRNLEYRHLRAFIVLADELHFNNAAERLHIAQPTLSQTLQQLEVATGAKLFERSTRKVALTPAGRALLVEARAAVEAFEAVLSRASQVARGQAGELSVGYEVSTGLEFLPQVLREFEERCPGISASVTEYDYSAPAAGLDTGETDVAFVRPPIDAKGLEMVTLRTEPRVLCVPTSHRFSGRESVSVAEVLPEPMLASPRPAGVWRDYWLLAEHRDGQEATVTLEVSGPDHELQAVAAGRGIIVTSATLERYYRRPGVCFIAIDGLEPTEIALAWPAGSTHPALGAFFAATQAAVGEVTLPASA